jgi:hypothetical protein
VVWSIVLPLIVAVVATYATNRVMRPSVNLEFEAIQPMVVPPSERTVYGNTLYSIKVTTDTVLKDAIPRLQVISKNQDLSAPLNTVVEPAFGWPLGEESFGPRTIGPVDYIIIASSQKLADGNEHLRFFFNEFYGHPGPEKSPLPEIAFLSDLQPGAYYMQIALVADGIAPATKTFKLDWQPSDGLRITPQ